MNIIGDLTGQNPLTDQVIAMDLLMSAKSAIKLYAVAATESATPELRATFEKHLYESIAGHAQVTAYAIHKGYYQPYHLQAQLQLDQSAVQTAVSIPS